MTKTQTPVLPLPSRDAGADAWRDWGSALLAQDEELYRELLYARGPGAGFGIDA